LQVERGAITATWPDGYSLPVPMPERLDAEGSPLILEATTEPCRVRVVLDAEARVYEPPDQPR
jgi:hypothetical protein